MAKILDKDPFTYQKERDSFLSILLRFHVGRGTGYKSIAHIGGKEVDLFLLYNKVTQLGGWSKITDEERWEEIQECFNIPLACTNSGQALKQIYIRYLSHYEKAHHFGEDPDRIRDDQMDESSHQVRKKATGLIGGVPLHYNYGQHNMPDHIRRGMGLKVTKELAYFGDYKNIENALMSGLPNEVDFALNVCTLLSNEGRHTIQLDKCPHLLKIMYAHIGIFEEDCNAMYRLHELGWKSCTTRNFSRFWYDSVRDRDIRKYIAPGSLDLTKSPNSSPHRDSSGDEGLDVRENCPDPLDQLNQQPHGEACHRAESPLGQDCQHSHQHAQKLNKEHNHDEFHCAVDHQQNCVLEPTHSADPNYCMASHEVRSPQPNGEDSAFSEDLDGVLAVSRDVGLYDVEGQRVLQLAMIIRNLSFEKENMAILSNDMATFRFLLLCIHNKYNTLKQLALDTLSNIALKMVLQPNRQSTTQLIFQLIAQCIASSDKFHVVSGLDMLAHLCQVEANEELICDNLEDKVYEDIIRLLTVHDIQMIVYTLEVLYQLSELGEVTTTHIAAVRMAVEMLVNLVTVEAQSYGPESLIGIKVVEHVTTIPVSGEKVELPSQASIQQQMATPQPATLIQPLPKNIVQPSTSHTTSTPTRPRSSVPSVVKRPPAAPTPPTRPVLVPTPPPSTPSPAVLTKAAQQSLKPQLDLDSDTLACNWLQAHYELMGTVGVETEDIPKMELYGEFLTTCGRLFIKNIANASSFANCVRMMFSKIESIKVKRPDGTYEQIYRGLRRRTVPLPFPPNTDMPAAIVPVQGLQKAPNTSVSSSPPPHMLSTHNRAPPPHPLTVMPQANAHGNQLHSPPPISPTKYPQGIVSPGQQMSPTAYPTIQHALMLNRSQEAAPQPPTPQSPQQTVQPANSMLIKSLLANKVTQNISRQQQGEQVWPSQNANQQWANPPLQPFQSYQSPQTVVGQQQPVQEPWTTTSLQPSELETVHSSPGSKSVKRKNSLTTPPGTPTSKPKTKSPRNRNNGRATVFTDCQIMADIIESVARQGSLDSEDEPDKACKKDNVDSGLDVTDMALDKPDTPVPVIPPEGVSEDPIIGLSPASMDHMESMEPMDVVQGSGDSDTIGMKPSCDTRQDNNLSFPPVNGTAINTVVNGSNWVVESNHASGDASMMHDHASGDATVKHSTIEKAKSQQPIMNGAVHLMGNGNCAKGLKSKDLEVLNNKICESTANLNPSSKTFLQVDSTHASDNSMDSTVKCDKTAGVSEADEASNAVAVLENGYASPSRDDNYHLPQVDGTHDDEMDAETSNAVQQIMPLDDDDAAAGVPPLVQTTPGQAAPSISPQPIPAQIEFQQGLPAQELLGEASQPDSGSASESVNVLVTPDQPTLEQPQVEQPQVVQVIQGQTAVIEGQPPAAQGQPQLVRAQPQVIQGQPQLVQGQHVVQGQAQVAAHLAQGQSAVVQPQVIQAAATQQLVQAQHPVVTAKAAAPVAAQPVAQPGQPQPVMQQVVAQPGQAPQLVTQSGHAPQVVQQTVINNPVQIQQQQQHLQLQQQQLQMQLQQLQQMQQQIQQQWIQTQQAQQQLNQTTGQPVVVQTSTASTTQASQSYILPKPGQVTQQTVSGSEQITAASAQAAQISPNQQQALIMPKPQGQQQQVQVLLRPPQMASGSVALAGQPQTTMVRLPMSMQQMSLQQAQAQAAQTVITQAQSQPQISVQTTRFVMPQGQVAVRPQTPITVASTIAGGQTSVMQQPGVQLTQPGQTQVLQQMRPPMVQGQAGQPQVVRTLVQQPRMVTAQGQAVSQQQFVQRFIQHGQVVQPGQAIPGQTIVVSGQNALAQPQLVRPQYAQSAVLAGKPTAPAQPQMITTQAQYLPKGQLVATSQPQLIQQTTNSCPKVTMIQYQQAVSGQKQLVSSLAQTSVVTSLPTVTAPTIQIPASQLTLPLAAHIQSPITLPTSVTPSPISTPPPLPSPQSSKSSLPSPTNTTSSAKKKRPATTPNEKSSKKKKPSSSKSRSSSTDSRPPSRSGQPSPAPAVQNKYHCEWVGCKKWFDSIKPFNKHIIKIHFEKQHQQAVCRWEGCDNLKRPKWSLMTHLQDRHMNDSSLKNPAKKQVSTPSTTQPPTKAVPVPSKPAAPTNPPVYPENAAMQAIRRFAARPPYAEFVEMKEGPVTKHIRLTAALILRNLARYSALGRSQLKKHEEHLSYVALSAVEASGPISNCLWELHQTDPH